LDRGLDLVNGGGVVDRKGDHFRLLADRHRSRLCRVSKMRICYLVPQNTIIVS
jgi:hypothetical protein